MAVRRTPRIEERPYYPPTGPVQGKSFWDKMGPILTVVLVVGSFAVGSMWTKIKFLEQGAPSGGNTAAQAQQAAAGGQQPAATQVTTQQLKDIFNKKVIKFGNANSKNLIVEFADPSCPYCHVAGGLNPELNNQIGPQFKLVADGGDYVAPVLEIKKLVDSGNAGFAWVFTPGHGNGEVGARALYCAYDEGKFWQAHDLLMTSKGYDLMNTTVKNDMSQVDKVIAFVAPAVNSSKFVSCMKNDTYKTRMGEETTLASSYGVQGTPGFFVNTTRFDGAYNWTDMKSAVK